MKKYYLYKSIYYFATFAPTLFFISYSNFDNSNSSIWNILRISGVLLIFFNIIIVLFQLIASYSWLYNKKSYIISIRPMEFFYSTNDRSLFSLTNQERAAHTLIGFALFVLCFTNIYQYLFWSESLDKIDSFNTAKFSFIDSLYFTSTTSATVGYGDIVPKSDKAKFFVTVQIWATFLYVITIFSSLPNMLNKIENSD